LTLPDTANVRGFFYKTATREFVPKFRDVLLEYKHVNTLTMDFPPAGEEHVGKDRRKTKESVERERKGPGYAGNMMFMSSNEKLVKANPHEEKTSWVNVVTGRQGGRKSSV
jgi:hypothetical protein